MSLFLSREDLTDLTGYKRGSKVIEWLAAAGYKFEIGGDGWPRVMLAAVEARLLDKKAAEPRKGGQPNWAALDEIVARSKKRHQST